MTAWHDRHGWKWIGAPPSGVLGLFTPQQAVEFDSQGSHLQDAPSNTSNNLPEATQSTPIHPDALPRSLRLVLLGVEIVLSLAVGLLCVWCASIARSASRFIVGFSLAECVYTAVFSYYLLSFFSKLFQQHGRTLVLTHLGLFWTPLSAVVLSIVFHTILLLLLGSNVTTFTSFTTRSISLRSVLFAPAEEELFFRGLVFHLALHRLRGNALLSAVVSSGCFALIHFANARHIETTGPTDLLLQIIWAAIVGLLLALRFAHKGSLLECILLHVANNFFAAVASESDLNKSKTLWIGILSIAAYSLASVREFLLFPTARRRP